MKPKTRKERLLKACSVITGELIADRNKTQWFKDCCLRMINLLNDEVADAPDEPEVDVNYEFMKEIVNEKK